MSCPAAVWLMDDLSCTIHSQPKPTSFPGLSPSRPYEVEPKLASRKGRENRGAILQLSRLLDPARWLINTAFLYTRPDWASLSERQRVVRITVTVKTLFLVLSLFSSSIKSSYHCAYSYAKYRLALIQCPQTVNYYDLYIEPVEQSLNIYTWFWKYCEAGEHCIFITNNAIKKSYQKCAFLTALLSIWDSKRCALPEKCKSWYDYAQQMSSNRFFLTELK